MLFITYHMLCECHMSVCVYDNVKQIQIPKVLFAFGLFVHIMMFVTGIESITQNTSHHSEKATEPWFISQSHNI